jgi:hypothetical protein
MNVINNIHHQKRANNNTNQTKKLNIIISKKSFTISYGHTILKALLNMKVDHFYWWADVEIIAEARSL